MASAYHRSNVILSVSDGLKKTISHHFPETNGKISVIYNGIDTEIFSIYDNTFRPAEMERRILFLGGMTPRKGLTYLLEACSVLKVKYNLTVAGPQATHDRVLSIAKRFGVAQHVCGIGLVGREKIAPLLNEHDVLVVASLHETFGLVVAEALACGTPVVATRCGGVEEILRAPYGRLVPVKDVQAMAGELEDVLTSMETYPAGAARQHVIDNFSIERLVSQLEETYERVLQ